MKKDSILIVDDNPKNIQVLANILNAQGFEIEYCLNGQSAIGWVEKNHFDLILLDIMMPVMDGYTACEKIKELPNGKGTPVVFITAKTDIDSLTKAFNVGGIDYITKPFNEKELLVRVNTHLDLKKHKDNLEELVELRTQELQKAYESLDLANKKLLEIDNAKSQFIHIISHEVRTPLNGILGSIQLLKNKEFTEKTNLYFDMLEESTERLEDFAFKTLDISQFNMNGDKMLNLVRVQISELIQSTILKFEESAKEKKVQISYENGLDNKIIQADVEYLQKCFFNIVDNAIKYSPENGNIVIETEIKENNIIIKFKDEGTGFEPGFVISEIGLFESKEHVDRNPGLSLFLCNQIINAHEGTIENGNNLDKGAFVKISLPFN